MGIEIATEMPNLGMLTATLTPSQLDNLRQNSAAQSLVKAIECDGQVEMYNGPQGGGGPVPCPGAPGSVCAAGMTCYAEGSPFAACIRQGMLGMGNPMGGGGEIAGSTAEMMPMRGGPPGCEKDYPAQIAVVTRAAKAAGCGNFMNVRARCR
jgi:hypothetical protein